MGSKRFDAMSDGLENIRAAVRTQVRDRLATGATLGSASQGDVLAVSVDPVTGARKTEVVGRYRRPSRAVSTKGDSVTTVEDAESGAQFLLHSDQ